ncbi:MAG: metallopeptidase family protein [Bacteroidetes bacterium]|nr:metallopeptidase family protein [Bacteroidota bacterium]
MLSIQEFEEVVQEMFDALPEQFRHNLDNVQIVVEEIPSQETTQKMRLRSPADLFGLYEGIPLNKRGTWYGMYPVVPDKITLYRVNIQRGARTSEEVRQRIRDVLIHEIAHYYGMNEEEVRAAGY